MSSEISVPKPFRKFDSAAAEKKIIRFIQKTVKGSGAEGVVLGLSGGIDSALVAALSVKAIGPENVHPFFFYESAYDNLTGIDSVDFRDASQVCSQFNLTLDKINLLPVFSAASASLHQESEDLISTGNLKSRLRMSMLYYYANKNHLLVIGTKNKTERLTGYYTKYGDGGVDLDPIADLYKTEVRLLSQYLDLPDSVLSKAPSAGFWAGQSDEDDFGIRYEQLDCLLYIIEKKGWNDFSKSGKDLKKLLRKTDLSENQYKSVISRMKSARHNQKRPDFPEIS